MSPDLLSIDSFPFASGGYGDVYEGTLGDCKICIKRVRVYTQDILQKAVKVQFFGALGFSLFVTTNQTDRRSAKKP